MPGVPGAPGERGARGEAGPPGRSVLAAVVVTDADGRAQWAFAAPLAAAPVVGALPVEPESGGGALAPLTVVLESVTAQRVGVRVWRTRPILGLGLLPAVPAGAGVSVHVTAVAPETGG